MNTQTFEFRVKTLEDILAEQQSRGRPWKEVKRSDFPPDKWTLREVDLSDDKLVLAACEEGNLILDSSGLVVEKFMLAEEINNKSIETPWMAIGMLLGVVGLALAGVVLGLALISLIVGAIALIFKVIAMLLPILVLGAALVGLALIDPVLIAIVRDGEEEKWISVAVWFD